MATIYASKSHTIQVYTSGTWAQIRGASSGTVYTASSGQTMGSAMSVQHNSGRGFDVYGVNRSFLLFDTSSITGTVASADLSIYGHTSVTADVIAVKSDAFGGDGGTAIAAADFNNFDTGTPYSSQISSWSTSGYNDIQLNATARADIQNNNVLIVCMMEHDYDFQNSAPSLLGVQSGMYHVPYTGTSRDPHLEVTVSTGYGHSVIGVAAANIGKVNAVATANIEKIIGT